MTDDHSRSLEPIPGGWTPELIGHLLTGRGALALGRVTQVAVAERYDGLAGEIARLELAYDTTDQGEPASVIAKRYGPDWYDDAGAPELWFYTDLAPRMPWLPVPALLGAEDDPATPSCVLLLEDLTATHRRLAAPVDDATLLHLADLLAGLHAAWWQAPLLEDGRFFRPERAATRMPQAIDPAGIAHHAAEAQLALDDFLLRHRKDLDDATVDLLAALATQWADLFGQRVADGHNVTLIHGDMHALGNVFVADDPAEPRFSIIDWTQAKRGIGVHDLMYLLVGLPSDDRRQRDTPVIARYHVALLANGVTGYIAEQCEWDFRFSALTNLWQAVFQDSPRWLATTMQVVDAWDCRALLAEG